MLNSIDQSRSRLIDITSVNLESITQPCMHQLLKLPTACTECIAKERSAESDIHIIFRVPWLLCKRCRRRVGDAGGLVQLLEVVFLPRLLLYLIFWAEALSILGQDVVWACRI